MLKLIIVVALSSLGQNQMFADVSEGLRRHGYPDVVSEEALTQVSYSLAKLIAISPKKAHEKHIKAHLVNLLEHQGVTDATYWVSIVRGRRVSAADILKDVLPKLTREFRPNRMGLGHYRNDTEVFYVSVFVHRAGELSLREVASESRTITRLTGTLYPGYFQPKVVCAAASGPLTEYTPKLNSNRQFELNLSSEVHERTTRIELVAEHVSGPRVLNLMQRSSAHNAPRLAVIRMERPSALQPATDLYRRINDVRINQGLSALAWDNAVATVADTHARFISKRRALTHKAQAHGHLRQRLSAQSMRPTYMAELLVSADSVLEALDAIRKSPAHFQQIGHQRVNTIGIGVEHGYYVVILARFEPRGPEVD